MKQIYGTDALQVLPYQNGFIFVVKQEEHEGKAVVAYRMLDLERMTMNAVTRNVYLLAKFGNLFERFEENPEDFLAVNTLFLPEHRLLVCDQKGEVSVYAGDGTVVYAGAFSYQGALPDSFVLGENCFWVSYPKAGAVIRYGLHSFRPELRIGGGAGPLPAPEGLLYQHDRLLFCSPTEQKVLQLDPVRFETQEYHTFEEPIHRYYKFHSHEIVVLDSGIYKL